jgi:hypothetical protein
MVLLECVTLLKHVLYCPPDAAAAAAAEGPEYAYVVVRSNR